jgi:hypothetical protein
MSEWSRELRRTVAPTLMIARRSTAAAKIVRLLELDSVIASALMKRAAIYARASPDCPVSIDEQIEHLTTAASEHACMVAHVFTDRPTAVKKDQDRRSGELALIEAIRSSAIDRVLVWSIDRIGKSLADLVTHGDLPSVRCCGVSGSGENRHGRLERDVAVRCIGDDGPPPATIPS